MRFKDFLKQIAEEPEIETPEHGMISRMRQVEAEPKVISGRTLMKLLAGSAMSDEDQESMEAALAGHMNRQLSANDVSRLARKARVDINSVLSIAKLNEAEQKKYHDFHEWMNAVKKAHPDFAKDIRFKVDGDAHVAYVRGVDRLFGMWEGDDDGEGIILEGRMKDAGVDLVEKAVQKMPRQPGINTRQYVLDLIDVVISLDSSNLFKHDREAIEQFIREYLGL